jgi:hypothetical protein
MRDELDQEDCMRRTALTLDSTHTMIPENCFQDLP